MQGRVRKTREASGDFRRVMASRQRRAAIAVWKRGVQPEKGLYRLRPARLAAGLSKRSTIVLSRSLSARSMRMYFRKNCRSSGEACTGGGLPIRAVGWVIDPAIFFIDNRWVRSTQPMSRDGFLICAPVVVPSSHRARRVKVEASCVANLRRACARCGLDSPTASTPGVGRNGGPSCPSPGRSFSRPTSC
jgi:hypothetical protein